MTDTKIGKIKRKSKNEAACQSLFKYFLPLKSNHFKAIAPKVPITVETNAEIRAINIL